MSFRRFEDSEVAEGSDVAEVTPHFPLASLTGLTRFSGGSGFSGSSNAMYIRYHPLSRLSLAFGLPLLQGATHLIAYLKILRCFMNYASHLHYALRITHYALLFLATFPKA